MADFFGSQYKQKVMRAGRKVQSTDIVIQEELQ